MKSRTTTYRFTTTGLKDNRIEDLKRQVRTRNALERLVRTLDPTRRTGTQSVRIRGRLGKDSPYAHLYRLGGPLHRYSSQDIRPEHASRFDVYVHTRW